MRNVTTDLLTTNKRNKYLFKASLIYKSLPSKPEVILSTCCSTPGSDSAYFRIQVHLSPTNEIDKELAYFNIYGNYVRAPFEQLGRLKAGISPPSMNINCEDYRGQGVSKMLMLIAFHFAKKEYPRFNDSTELFIDTDASTIVGKDASGNKISYWSAIGMTDNESSPSSPVSKGYEKRCIVRELHPYLFR